MAKKIMIVDDNPDVIFSVKSGLENVTENFRIIGVESGEKCLEILETEKPDLILLDIMMPGMSGWKTFDKIKENESWKKIPVVFLTARTDRVAKNAGGFLGEDYVEKPFNIEDLKLRIDQVLEVDSDEETND
ncbi:MAG: response regulator [Candidatus Thermoplasmatota archaeon]|nr:response regulator [Candidatus Thermoplasmatota archaeon]MBS3801628.1 response regulator [Candidatus Thermoplasmatota archaeon]